MIPALGVIYEGYGDIDLRVAQAAGARGAWFKAGTGLGDVDDRFFAYTDQAEEVAMPFGCAWWPKPHLGKPEEQADVFAVVINQTLWTIPPYPDFEVDDDSVHLTSVQRADFLYRFYGRLGEHCAALSRDLNVEQRTPWIYTLGKQVSGGWWDNNVAPAGVDWSGIPFRLARYVTTDPARPQPVADSSTWEAYAMGSTRVPKEPWAAWQFSSSPNGLGKALLGPGCTQTNCSINLVKDDVWARLFPPPPPTPVDPVVAELREIAAYIADHTQETADLRASIVELQATVAELRAVVSALPKDRDPQVADMLHRLAAAGTGLTGG